MPAMNRSSEHEASEVIPACDDRHRAEVEHDWFFSLSVDLLCVIGFDGRLERVNPSWEATLGFTSSQLQAEPILKFVHPEDKVATAAQFERLYCGNQPMLL